MLTQAACSLLLLLPCCLWSAEGQSVWDDPIQFKTKGRDQCTMIVTGQGQYTRLRLSCQGPRRAYWCEYVGTPQKCGGYNKNPRHYFVQMMWGLRKLHNACQAPRTIKPQMCRKAPDDSQMVFTSASFPRPAQEASPETRAGPVARTQPQTQAQPQPQPQPRPRPEATRPDDPNRSQASTRDAQVPPRVVTGPQPTAPANESNAKSMARRYCWRSLQGICSYTIKLFGH